MDYRRPALAASAVAAASALLVQAKVVQAKRRHPPLGQMMRVDGVRLHYLEQGEGTPLVLLHGLGSLIEDFAMSGLIREASRRYRVIAIDRPGYGYSSRPRTRLWGPSAQAELIRSALRQLGVEQPIVLGHSWGTLVAAALALDHPEDVRTLVLASGLYFPSMRADAALLIPPAIPVVGDLMRYTLSPLVGRALWNPALKLVFRPHPVPQYFKEFSPWRTLAPAQLRAVGEDAAATLPTTMQLARRYRELEVPVVLVAGSGDAYVDPHDNTVRLQNMLPDSHLLLSPHAGHMVHHSDLPLVMQAIDLAAAEGRVKVQKMVTVTNSGKW